jgi:hypothetical protein
VKYKHKANRFWTTQTNQQDKWFRLAAGATRCKSVRQFFRF